MLLKFRFRLALWFWARLIPVLAWRRNLTSLLALAKRNRVPLPADDVEGLRDWFRFRDFDQFVEVYLACSAALKRPEDFQTLVADFAADQERENVRYTEINFTIGTHWLNGLPAD